MSGGYGTGYDETEALLAAMDGDDAEVRRRVADMTFGERDELGRALRMLSTVLDELG